MVAVGVAVTRAVMQPTSWVWLVLRQELHPVPAEICHESCHAGRAIIAEEIEVVMTQAVFNTCATVAHQETSPASGQEAEAGLGAAAA